MCVQLLTFVYSGRFARFCFAFYYLCLVVVSSFVCLNVLCLLVRLFARSFVCLFVRSFVCSFVFLLVCVFASFFSITFLVREDRHHRRGLSVFRGDRVGQPLPSAACRDERNRDAARVGGGVPVQGEKTHGETGDDCIVPRVYHERTA